MSSASPAINAHPPAAPEGFEVVDNPERLFDPEATLIMRAVTPPVLPHGLDVWTTKLIEKPIHNLVWTSARGVLGAFRRAAKSGRDFTLARHLSGCSLFALGDDTAAVLRGLGLPPRLVAANTAALVRRLPATELRMQRVALQLDAADADTRRRDSHPVTTFLRSVRARTYTINVGTPKAD